MGAGQMGAKRVGTRQVTEGTRQVTEGSVRVNVVNRWVCRLDRSVPFSSI